MQQRAGQVADERQAHKSMYRGVSWSKSSSKWVATVYTKAADGRPKSHHAGFHATEVEAAQAHNRLARQLLPAGALHLNDVPDGPEPPAVVPSVPQSQHRGVSWHDS